MTYIKTKIKPITYLTYSIILFILASLSYVVIKYEDNSPRYKYVKLVSDTDQLITIGSNCTISLENDLKEGERSSLELNCTNKDYTFTAESNDQYYELIEDDKTSIIYITNK